MTHGHLSRLAAIGLLGLVLGSFWALAIQPLGEWRQAQLTELERTKLEIERLTLATARLEAERDSLQGETTISKLWDGTQPGEISARIQSHLNDAASESGISFRSITPLPPRSAGTYTSFGFRLEFEAGLGQLARFLQDVEYAAPALPVERATLRRVIRPGDRSEQPIVFAQIDIVAPVLTNDGNL